MPVGCRDRVHDLDTEAISRAEGAQDAHISCTLPPEPVIVADEELPQAEATPQNQFDK